MTIKSSSVASRILLLLLLGAPATLRSQSATGELSITITDPSGAIVRDAEVTVTGTDTGATVRVLRSNDRGIAEVPVLQPGRYNTHIVMPGFETVDRTGVSVDVGSIISLDITLTLGASNQTVTVNGDAPLIEDKSETIAQVINSKELTDLPLNGRNYLEAANYIPGVIPSSSGRDNSFSAYGNTGLQNAFLLDGSRNVNYLRGLDNQQRDMVRPPLDALLQFTVQTSNFSAEFGASAGAVVNAITKSGTNTFHGSAYDFLRNNALDATNYFATLGKPLLVRNQYGASLGGPIWRDKAFFFAAYEGIHQRSENNGRVIVPTALERMGNFSRTTTTSAAGVMTVTPIFDPSTTQGTGAAATRTQFAGNMIPAARINAIGQMLANSYPLPNLPSAGPNTFSRNAPSLLDSKNGIGRLDYQISPKDSVFARYAHAIQGTANQATLPAPASDPGVSTITTKGIGSGYTRVLTNSLLDELRFSWTRVVINSAGIAPRNEIIPGSLDPLVNTGTPSFGVGIYAGLGGQAPCCASSPLAKSSDVYDIADNVSYSRGKHQIKLGGDFLIIKPHTFSTIGGRSNFGFSGAFSQNPKARGSSGSALADLLLGDANSLTTGTEALSDERGVAYGIYVSDQYQISESLTLNYGARYEYSSPFIEAQNHLGNFILDPGSPFYGKLVFAGNPAFPRSLLYPDRNNIAPRLGFAYRVPGVKEMTVRSSYGIFYAQDEGTGVTNRLTSNPPFFGYGSVTVSSDQLNPATGFVLTPGVTIPRPNPIPASSFTLVPAATSALVSWNEHLQTPYVQQWSLSVQKQFAGAILAEVNYVGNHGSQLLGAGQGNQPTVLNTTAIATRRPLAAYTVAPVKTIGNWNSSQYEGLSAKLQKRFSKGNSFLNAITYGHAFDLQNPALDLCDTCGVGDTIQDNNNRAVNYASADNDVRFRYVVTGIVQSPIGRGKMFGNSRILSIVAGGWAVSPVYQYQTGLPFTPAATSDLANAGTVTRPNQTCNGNVGGAGTLQQYFNTVCYSNPAPFTFGNAGRNSLRAPGRNLLNVSLQRNFPLHFLRESNLNTRLEGFNVLNHPQFNAPGNTVGSQFYGIINGAGAPRQVQIAARLTF